MTGAFVLWMVGSTLLGVFLVFVGWRGRRVNDHPTCRQCGFDLVGVLPAASMCPECGSGVRQARFVRIGQRTRVWTLIVVGAPLAILPMVPLAVTIFAAATQTEVAGYKPLGLLLWEISTLERRGVIEAGRELHQRQMAGGLTGAEYDLLVETILSIQRDEVRPWTPELATILTQARMDGKVKDEDYRDFVSSSAVMEWSARARVKAGSRVAIRGGLREGRVNAGTDVVVYQLLESVRIGDLTLVETKLPLTEDKLLPEFNEWGGTREPLYQSVTVLNDPNNQFARMTMGAGMGGGWNADENAVWFELAIPPDLKPGFHDVEFKTAAAGAVYDAYAMGWGRAGSGAGAKARWSIGSRVIRIEVLPADEPVVATITATAAQDDAMTQFLTPTTVSVTHGREGPYLSVSFNIAKPPSPFAYRVSCRLGEKPEYLGLLTTGKLPPESKSDRYSGTMWAASANGQMTLWTSLGSEFVNKEVELVFTPALEQAAKTVDLTSIYGGEIVVKGVAFGSPPVRTAIVPAAPGGLPNGPTADDASEREFEIVESAGATETGTKAAEVRATKPPPEEGPVTVEPRPVRKRSLFSWLFGS